MTGPMSEQPTEHRSTMPAQSQPRMPEIGTKPEKPPKRPSARAQAVRTAKAKISRRNSLRKQRQALKD